jgi:CRISPR/Cas system-associated endonuclease/helicase Cas3
MIEDAATDTANIRIAVQLNEKRIIRLDSLCSTCFNYIATQNQDEDIYRLYRYGLVHPDFINPTERTLLQLKNSGGMRLIRRKAAVDSIIAYDDMAKKLVDQQAYYEHYQNESINSSLELLNFKYYQSYHTGLKFKNSASDYTSAQLLNRDKTKVIQLGNRIMLYKGVVDFYNARLMEMNIHAVNLITTLKKEYLLEDE